VLRLHGALTNAGRSAEANKVAADWFASHPRDAGAHTYFGDMALAKGDYATAERHFAAVVSEQPKNVMAWNNLAWARAKTGNPSASDTARRAVSLAPESAVLLDTLAVALESEKKDAEGEEVRRKAVALAPSNGELRLGLAKAYLRHGKQAEAKNELQKVLRGNVAAETRKEAEGLLQRM
jgi:Flp pilus assembly protein TadD